jgi:hypothetical membrane protein
VGRRTVERALNVAGITGPLLWVAAVVSVGSLRPEYSHYRHYISELAARGTPTQHLMQVVGFILPGLLVAGFGVLVGLLARTRLAGAGAALLVVSGIARIVAGAFPANPCCAATAASFSERAHDTAGLAYVLLMGTAVLVWCVVAEPAFSTRAHWFRWYSVATFVAASTLPWLLLRLGADPANVGLFQRVSFGVLNLWILVFAVATWSRSRSATATC